MNLLYGIVEEIFEREGVRMAKTRVQSAYMVVTIEFLHNPSIGDRILISDGVAISKVKPETEPR